MEKIKIQGPYNFEQVLDRLSIDPLNVVNMEKQTVQVPLYIDGEPVVAEIKGVGTLEEPVFQISTEWESKMEKIIFRLTEIFHWDRPLAPIHNYFLKTDLSYIFQKYRGMPLILDFDPYRCLIKCIIHQQLNMKFAYTLSTRFAKQFGFGINGVTFYPEPDTLANLDVEQLRELQFSTRKGEYVIGVAKAIVSGQLNFEELKERTDDEVLATLTKLKGVGPWTGENFLLFALGRENLFPKADIGIQNAIKKLYQLDRKPTFEEMDEYKRPWEPYLSYASLYLWRSIE